MKFLLLYMATCELCGKQTSKLIKIDIAGSRVLACDNCKNTGRIIKQEEDLTNLKHSFKKKQKNNIKQEVISNYSQILNKTIAKKGLNIHQLAKALNIKESSLNKYFSGKIQPDVETALKIGRYLEINLLENVENTNNEDFLEENESQNESQSFGDLLLKKLKESKK